MSQNSWFYIRWLAFYTIYRETHSGYPLATNVLGIRGCEKRGVGHPPVVNGGRGQHRERVEWALTLPVTTARSAIHCSYWPSVELYTTKLKGSPWALKGVSKPKFRWEWSVELLISMEYPSRMLLISYLFAGNKLGLVASSNSSAAMTGGLVQEFNHSVLPSVKPLATFLLTALFIIVSQPILSLLLLSYHGIWVN